MICVPGRQEPSRHHCSSEVGQGALEDWFTGAHNLKLRRSQLVFIKSVFVCYWYSCVQLKKTDNECEQLMYCE